MAAYIDGMCHICPKNGVLHSDVGRTSPPVPAVIVQSDAVVRIAHEDIVNHHTAAAHHVNAVTPTLATE